MLLSIHPSMGIVKVLNQNWPVCLEPFDANGFPLCSIESAQMALIDQRSSIKKILLTIKALISKGAEWSS